MRLIFSTAYDEIVFKNTFEANVKYIGPLGLLNILEREVGLYDIYKSEKDRINDYLGCLIEHQNNTFFKSSLNANALNVAGQLLVYRDELILLGWDFLNKDQPKRFSDLSTVEASFINKKGYKGNADRWRITLENLSDEKIKEFNILSIIVEDPKENLPQYLQQIFNKMDMLVSFKHKPVIIENCDGNLTKLKNQFNNIIHNLEYNNLSDEFVSLKKDTSLQLVSFKNEQLLVDCLASYADNNCLVINRENANFDYSLVAIDKPAAGSKQVKANPQIIQIVKLIIPCFSKELNIQTLVSFLTLSHNPLEFTLTKELVKLLTKKPGVNSEEWKTIIDCYIGVNRDKEQFSEKEENLFELFKTKEVSEEELKSRKKLVNLFLKFNETEEKGVKKGKKIVSYLQKWASGMKKLQGFPELKEQFKYISQVCKNILDNFNFENDTTEALEEMIKSFYEAQNFTNYYKQQNSIEVLKDISAIAQPTNKKVFWLDFNADGLRKSTQFLLEEEKKFLKEKGSYNNPENEFNLQLKQWLNGVLNCKNELILCVVENSDKEKHPLHIRLEGIFGESCKNIIRNINSISDFLAYFDLEKITLSLSKNIPLPLSQDYFSSDILSNIKKRNVESASSIEKFIEYPFDWVMQYVAKFSNDVGFNIPDGNLLKGNVAHKTIELMFKAFPDFNFKETDLDCIFNMVLESEAAIFLQPEKRFDLSEFKYRFYKSFKNLVDIIKINEFEIEALEYSFGKENSCVIDELLGNVSGYIDIYLKDKEENPFIIDLKWGYSDKKYIKKIEKNEAIQLAIYTAAIKQRKLTNTAYFMLNQNKLITAAANIKGNHISQIDSVVENQELLGKIKTSLEFRWSEIRQGKLEIGDNFSLEGLQYYNENGVLGIPEDNKVKKAYPYSGYKLFKGVLK